MYIIYSKYINYIEKEQSQKTSKRFLKKKKVEIKFKIFRTWTWAMSKRWKMLENT